MSLTNGRRLVVTYMSRPRLIWHSAGMCSVKCLSWTFSSIRMFVQCCILNIITLQSLRVKPQLLTTWLYSVTKSLLRECCTKT